MADQRTFRLRVTFCKQGRLAMLSHLEVARALERAVRRAGLPYAVSQGFSPHMKIAFGAALPVGVGGTHEIFDVQLVRYVAPEKALAALQDSCSADLMVKTCRYIEPRDTAASVAYPVSSYRALLSCAPAEFPVVKSVLVQRKKKDKELVVSDYLVGDVVVRGAVVEFSLEAKPTGSLRPDKFLQACVDAYNERQGTSMRERDDSAEADPNLAEGLASVLGSTGDAGSFEGRREDAGDRALRCAPGESIRVLSLTRVGQRAC